MRNNPRRPRLPPPRKLITVKGATALWEPLVPGVIEQAKSVFIQANPTLIKELNEVAVKLRAEYAPRSAEVVNDVAKLYASRFTEQELKDTLAFYKSPLGRKLLDRGALDPRPEHEKRAELGRPAVARGDRQDPHRNETTRARDLVRRSASAKSELAMFLLTTGIPAAISSDDRLRG